jgi:SAM-dependent methyltransferase
VPRAPQPKDPDEPDAVFVPTPQDVVERMVEVADVRREDVVYDLGCGDGRIVVTAARRRGCQAVGYDIDPDCVRLARENVLRHALSPLVTIERRDIFTLDLCEADVVMLYLSPELNKRLLPQLAGLRPGARVVSHAFEIPGVTPDLVVTVPSAEDDLDHKVYVWTAPLKKAPAPRMSGRTACPGWEHLAELAGAVSQAREGPSRPGDVLRADVRDWKGRRVGQEKLESSTQR